MTRSAPGDPKLHISIATFSFKNSNNQCKQHTTSVDTALLDGKLQPRARDGKVETLIVIVLVRIAVRADGLVLLPVLVALRQSSRDLGLGVFVAATRRCRLPLLDRCRSWSSQHCGEQRAEGDSGGLHVGIKGDQVAARVD